MAPKTLIKRLKLKPVKPLALDPEVKPTVEEVVACAPMYQPVVLPSVTEKERQCWSKARALQRSDEHGQPAEGWAARIAAMKADGRLIERAGAWYTRV
jgi:hypothetical protein